MDRIASKNEKIEIAKSFNDNFKEKNEFNPSVKTKKNDVIPKKNIDNSTNNFNSNDNNNNKNKVNSKDKEKSEENKNINHNGSGDDDDSENTNESVSKGDISGIIVGSENENFNSQKSVEGQELEEKMDNEIISNQGFDDIPNNNNIIQDNNNDFYLNSEEELTATMELTQPFSNPINVNDSIQTNYSDNISIANQLINSKTNSQIININNLSTKKNSEIQILKDDSTTQSNIINFSNLPIHDETLHTEVMDIDLSLSINKPINTMVDVKNKTENNVENFELDKKEDNIAKVKLFTNEQRLKDLLNKKNENTNTIVNSNLSNSTNIIKDKNNEHNNEKGDQGNELLSINNNKETNYQNRENISISNKENQVENIKSNIPGIDMSHFYNRDYSELITKNENRTNYGNSREVDQKIQNEDETQNDNTTNQNNTIKSVSEKSVTGSRKESRYFLFSSQQSNLSTLTTDDRFNDSYNDYNTYINDIIDLIPDSPDASTNGTQNDHIFSQQSDTGSTFPINKDEEKRINKIDQLLKNDKNSHNPSLDIEYHNQNKENEQVLSSQLEKENDKRLEKLKVFENIDKEFENEDESYNFMASYGKDRRKRIENSANFILKNNIIDLEKLNQNDESITNNLYKNRYRRQSEFLNNKLAELRRISRIGLNKTNDDNNTTTTTNNNNNKNSNNNNDNNNNNNNNSTTSITNNNNNDINTNANTNTNTNTNAKIDININTNINTNTNLTTTTITNNNNNIINNNNTNQNLLLMRNQSQNSVINEYINILTPIKNSLVKRMANKSNGNNFDQNQKENNINVINEYRLNNLKIPNIMNMNSNKIEDALFQNHTLEERDFERNDSIKLSSTIDVLPTTSPNSKFKYFINIYF